MSNQEVQMTRIGIIRHLCTCSFAKKTEKGWDNSQGGFCGHIEKIAQDIARAAELPCVLGTAHLPKGYTPVTFEK